MSIKPIDKPTGRIIIREEMTLNMNTLMFSPPFWQLLQEVERSGQVINISISEHPSLDDAKTVATQKYGGSLVWESTHETLHYAELTQV